MTIKGYKETESIVCNIELMNRARKFMEDEKEREYIVHCGYGKHPMDETIFKLSEQRREQIADFIYKKINEELEDLHHKLEGIN